METPLLYIVLGAAGSGRRRVIADLIRDGLGDTSRVHVLVAGSEAEAPGEVSERLAAAGRVSVGAWTLDEAGRLVAEIPEGVTEVFILADGRADPVDQIEAVHGWLPSSGLQLGRVLTVLNCRLAVDQPGVARWHDACIHFSDVVILANREGVPNKWISDFQGRLRKAHFPCLVEMTRKAGFANAAALLEPQARRISLFFDDPEEWPEIDEEELLPGETLDLVGKEDPYIERTPAGRRAIELPDIRRFLGPLPEV
ncbi:MAG: hypothetical protein D6781_04000 [Verrucomicrobia bacterium]|nr:MAG: hypothetical protein D6781_04000 [Verrucomicrobiota bacterium]